MTRRRSINTAAAVLWASAFVLTALVITQAGRLPLNPAYADMAGERGEYTVISTSGGRGDKSAPNQIIYVLDSRDQVLMVYEVEDIQQRVVSFRYGANLPVWFNNARR